MSVKQNEIIYTSKDIEQYLTGKLTPLQMHEMEKAALDDEFLAEAIEGYQINNQDWQKSLASLKTQLANSGTAKVVALPNRNHWWKAAAAVLILAFGSVAYYFIFNKKETPQIAQNIKPTIVADSAVAIAPAAQDKNIDALQKNELKVIQEKNKDTFIKSNIAAAQEKISADSTFVYKPNSQAAPPIIKSESEKNFADAAAPVQRNANTDATQQSPANNKAFYNNAETNNVGYKPNQSVAGAIKINQNKLNQLKTNQQQLTQLFKAQVVGTDNSPLPFCNIAVVNENFGTYSDSKGNFSLISGDSAITVKIKSLGYAPKTAILKSGVLQSIVLAEQDVMDKKTTVVGNSNAFQKNKSLERARLLKDSSVNVEPVDGWGNYNTYIGNNLELPVEVVNNNLHGQVELSFDVNSDGKLTNIAVDKSLCDNCDAAAKRLIEQGPQWKTKNGKKHKGKIVVQF